MRGDDFYLKAFWELATCRDFGLGLGPIPWFHCVQYAQLYGLDHEMTQLFVNVIRELDECYLKEQKRLKDGQLQD